MPNPILTSEPMPLGYFNHDLWGDIIRRLPIRQQVRFRTLSREMRDVVDINKLTTYAKLLSRCDNLNRNTDASHPEPIRFFNTWVANFRFKLKGDELDFFCGVVTGNRALVNDLLMKNPMLVNLCDVQGNMAFHYAAACGQLEIFHDLYQVAKRIDGLHERRVNVITRKKIYDDWMLPLHIRENTEKETPYDFVIRFGHLKKFTKIFNLKDLVTLKTLQKSAARYGKIELLLDHGLLSNPTTIDEINRQPNTLLHIAARYGQGALLARFMQNPRYDNAFLRRLDDPQVGANVFHLAVQSGNEALVDDLLKRDPSLIESNGAYSRSVLYYAVASNKLSMVRKIHALQPNAINENDNRIENSLSCAIEQGNLEILKFLLEKDARINIHYFGNLRPVVKKFSALKKDNADTKDLQKYQDMVVYLVNYFAQTVKEKKYSADNVLYAYDRALSDAIEGEADELLPILTAAGAKPTDLYLFRNTNEQEKQVLPKVRRDLIDEYQQKYKVNNFIYYGKWALSFIGFISLGMLLAVLAIALAAGAVLGAQALFPSLLLMPAVTQNVIYATLVILTFLLPYFILAINFIPLLDFIERFFPKRSSESDVDESRQLSPVINVTPLYDPLLAKQYYLEPLKAVAKPENIITEAMSSPAAVVDKGTESVLVNPPAEKEGHIAAASEGLQGERVNEVKSPQVVIDPTVTEQEVQPPCFKA